MTTAISLYCDGGCILKNPSVYGAQWAYCLVDPNGIHVKEMSGIILRANDPDKVIVRHPERVIVVPSGEINPNGLTNQLSELIALTLGIESLPLNWEGHVYSDSESALHRMFRQASMGGIPLEWQYRCQLARERQPYLDWTLLGGHPTKSDLETGIRAARPGKRALPCSVHQNWADLECQRLAARFMRIYHAGRNRAAATTDSTERNNRDDVH